MIREVVSQRERERERGKAKEKRREKKNRSSRAIEEIDFRFPMYVAATIADLTQFLSSFLLFLFLKTVRACPPREGEGGGEEIEVRYVSETSIVYGYHRHRPTDRPTNQPTDDVCSVWTNALSKPPNSIALLLHEMSRLFAIFANNDTNRLLSHERDRLIPAISGKEIATNDGSGINR